MEVLHNRKHIFDNQTNWANKKKEFAVVALDSEYKVFIIHIVAPNVDLSNEVYSSKKAQIAHLKVDEVLTKIFSKFADFADIFLPKLAIKLFKHTGINDYAIELIDN